MKPLSIPDAATARRSAIARSAIGPGARLGRQPVVAAFAAFAVLAAHVVAGGATSVRAQPALAAGVPAVHVVRWSGAGQPAAYDGVVEAVRQTVVAAQVAGAIVALDVRAGDRVKAGQVLARIDARSAEQAAAASDAQVNAARAALEVAAREHERQRQLFRKQYISQAAFERAEAQYKAAKAQADAQLAQAALARTQTGLHVVRAPYAGVVSDVPVALGDMAMPGRALLTLHDPGALRVAAAVPQAIATALDAPALAQVRAELAGLPAAQARATPVRVQVLPTLDAGTHTALLRADLPAGLAGVSPGQSARLWVPVADDGARRALVPVTAVVRRAELAAVYVLDAEQRPLLRQVRLGRALGERVEVLAGLREGERVVLDAAALRAPAR